MAQKRRPGWGQGTVLACGKGSFIGLGALQPNYQSKLCAGGIFGKDAAGNV